MIAQENDPAKREFLRQEKAFDVVVVGAGPAGVCAALAAARNGAKTALVTDRPVLGGSASSEVRVTPSGADAPPWNRFARESGIMEEISLLLAHKTHASGIWRWIYYDELYFDLCHAEPNLEFFLNTSVHKIHGEPGTHITSVEAIQLRSEKIIEFRAPFFVDASGDGTVGFLAGADYRFGREAKSEFNETYAPEEADTGTMGATLLFSSIDRGHPVPYTAPDWALDVHDLPTLIEPEKTVARGFYRQPDGSWYGLWWAEYGGVVDSIHDDDDVMWHTRQLVYGLWDYIKNSGKYPDVERQELDWIAYLPGKRESRRLLGPVIITANDFLAQQEYEDSIGFCGWTIDIHPPQGYRDPLPGCTHDALPGISDIPFRCLYSRNVDNLLFAGRNISVSHEGLGTLRVIATTAVMGEAVGTAAAYALEHGLLPSDVAGEHMPELQRRLVRNDQSLVGYQLREEDDLSRSATVRASSHRKTELPEGTQWLTLTSRIGLLLPIETGSLESISFQVRAAKDTNLTAQAYACDKPQNYRLEHMVGEDTQPCSGTGWVTFHLDADPGPGLKLFVVLTSNRDLCLRYANTQLTGAFGFELWGSDITAKAGFRSKDFTPCFRTVPEQDLFRPECAVDSYIRPHGLPHLWASEPLDPAGPQWLELDLGAAKPVQQVELVFNTNLNIRRHAISGMYPQLVKDYDVIAVNGETEICVVRERGNVRRFRRHTFDTVQASALRLIVYNTWGSPYAEVFDFRVY